MRKGLLFSGLLHLAVILVAFFGLPHLLSEEEIRQPIPVQMVDIAEVTTPPKQEEKPQEAVPEAPPKAPTPPQVEEPPQPQKAEAPPPPPAPPARPEPEPAPVALPEPVPVPTPPEHVPEPKKEPTPEPQQVAADPLPVPELKPKPPKREVAEAKPKEKTPDKEKPAEPDFASALKDLEKDLRKQLAEAPSAPEPAPQSVSQPAPSARNLSDEPLTISEIDAIRAQIEKCWNVPVGARDAENLVVELRVTLNPDGTVYQQPKILDTARMASDPFFRAAAESARRAVLKCSPLRMPPKKYKVWKEVTLRFDPSRMF